MYFAYTDKKIKIVNELYKFVRYILHTRIYVKKKIYINMLQKIL